jgi:serine-aspartate repeat-containing protein C/D/E
MIGNSAPTRAQGRRRLRRKERIRGLVAVVATVLTVAGLTGAGLSLNAGAANASAGDPAGITTSLLINGNQTYNGVPVVSSGDQETLQIQYSNQVVPGSTLKIKLGDNVTVGALPPTNTAITAITKEADGTVDITFANPWPGDVNQGVLSLNFTVNPVGTSQQTQLTWGVNGTANAKDVIVLKPGDAPENVTDGQSKGESGNYNGAVSVTGGVVHIAESAVGKELNYTLTASTTTANAAYSISDQLPAGLAYVAGSISANLTTWDAAGLNRTVTDPYPFTPTVTGDSFSGTADLPADSILKVTYKAAIPDDAARSALEAQLQAKYDALNGQPGTFSIALTNTASIGGNPKSATVTMSGNVAGPSGPVPGQAFSKSSDWSTQNVTPTGDGSLIPAVPVTYTLKANLSQWDGSNPLKTLGQNVVITDTLPSQVVWDTGAGFVTPSGITLTSTTCPVPASDFVADAYIGEYCVSGQTLLVNVGHDNTTNATIQAQALINTVAGLPAGTTTVQGGKAYVAGNTANFSYAPGNGYNATRNVTVVDRGAAGPGGYVDPSVFAKTTSPSQITLQPGQSTTVNYTFTVNAQTDTTVDAADVKIVDNVDPNVFDLTQLAAIQSGVTGTYGATALTANDFALTLDGTSLTIALSAAGLVKAVPSNQNWTVHLPLPTKPVVGKQTIAVNNTATVYSATNTPLYTSTVSSQVSSYGDEAEVRKTVRDSANETWTSNLRAQLDADGNLVDSTYVYQVQFIPHGNYDHVTIVPVNDVLPAGTSFLGFVTAANVDTAADPTAGPVDVGGNIEATYNAADGTMSLVQKPGTVLDASQPITAYFAVQIVDYKADVPIVNKIGPTSASITPSDGYPLAIAKQDSTNQNTVIDDPHALFQLKDVDGNVVVDDIFVDNGYLRVAGPGGQPVAVKVTQPGTYTLSEVVPPAGYVKSDDTLQIVVTAGSLPDQQTFFDAPVGPSVSVGDYVWVDSNRDGRQDPGEPGIPGVVLTITGPDGNAVTGVNGMPVGPVTTDANGKYLFPGLPVLGEGQHYTVSIDRTASKAALAPYLPTTSGTGDRGGDSSTWTASSEGLTEGGQSDLTLDFGFVQKTYAIGDKVWIDTNRNGVQDGGEPPLAGVKVALLNGRGATIATTTTDANGRYIFDDLPAGTYQVKFTLTPAQAAKYAFTSKNTGTTANDSDADTATGLTKTFVLGDDDTNLTTNYTDQNVHASQGIDPTWDAGVVLIGDPLAFTGGSVPPVLLPALVLILGGLLLFVLRRRTRTAD